MLMPAGWLCSSGWVRNAALNYLAPRAGCTSVSSGCRALLREDWAGLELSSSAESLLHPPAGLRLESQDFFPLKSAGILTFPSLLASEPTPPQSE